MSKDAEKAFVKYKHTCDKNMLNKINVNFNFLENSMRLPKKNFKLD